MKIELLEYPTEKDWMEVKRRALVTVGKKPVNAPDNEWKRKILYARHSPIRYLRFSFYLEIPYYVSVHLVRHVHAQPYVRSQRNDRQDAYDRCAARQDAPVAMIWDLNAEELMVVANKRLCLKSDPATREVVERMSECLRDVAPEVFDMMMPMCTYTGGVCYEMEPCDEGGAHGKS
jgi:thymidylate synthase ThyX